MMVMAAVVAVHRTEGGPAHLQGGCLLLQMYANTSAASRHVSYYCVVVVLLFVVCKHKTLFNTQRPPPAAQEGGEVQLQFIYIYTTGVLLFVCCALIIYICSVIIIST
eukprot:GHVS01054930.1.p1 GENE.GHVS01054930.1~~GHVS01054930.1.p1  ORF type:complete len:108 (+),score=23.79 GHVS01054930.1:278-601(+)